jgi:hypothetical protein
LKTLIFTVCTAEQYPFAKVLSDSLPKNRTFKVGVIDGNVSGPDVVTLDKLSINGLDKMRERYDSESLVPAAKPYFASYFLRSEGVENVIYFDPTVQVMGDLEVIIQALQTTEILLTPRITGKFGKVIYGDEKLFLNTGMYDAGFWAIHKSGNTFRFLKWWQDRLIDRAHFDLCNGMNHEQLWLNYVPVFFENVAVNKNKGWNVGLQNLHERILTKQGNKWMVNQMEPLLFINFRECLSDSILVKKLLEQSGAAILRADFVEQVKKYSSQLPAIFSLRATGEPTLPPWKRELRKKLQEIIDKINNFPLYHKITK